MRVYFDTNVYYYRYCPSESSELVDVIIDQLGPGDLILSCEIMIAEMFRAFKKQANLGVIGKEEMELAVNFFLSDVKKLEQKKKIELIPIDMKTIMISRQYIVDQSLYAVDAIHAATAVIHQCDEFLTFDRDFKKLNIGIPIIHPENKRE
ncbi:MAG: type II toxin-antitoxin system VapC family toxin [Candidatus Lokiarchaeota archaeon]|nr:type II toxin-antitoxin system VapC family toxin [Candidatus Lokiarchaeota archaeon]